MLKSRRLWRLIIGVILAAALVIVGAFLSEVVQASHTFSDVPTTAFYHNAVEWVFNRAITAGCAPGMYCPDATVTRGTMAVFLHKLGLALSPEGNLVSSESGTTIDLDTSPVVCATSTNYTPTFAQVSVLWLRASVKATAGGFADVWLLPVYSTDSGATWSTTAAGPGDPQLPTEARAQDMAGHAQLANYGVQELTTGVGYRFAMRLLRASGPISGGGGTADIAGHRCSTLVAFFNRNPGMSPLGPGGR